MDILKRVKIANRLTTDAYDEELTEMIEEAKADLKLKGITQAEVENDPNIRRAIVTYCCIHHGQREDRELLMKTYQSLKATLGMSTGYTRWAEGDDAGETAAEESGGEGTETEDDGEGAAEEGGAEG